MTKRVADLIADVVVRAGIRDVFMITGGGAMHLNDAFARHPGLKLTFCHHEQACAMAAESYARLTGRPALVSVTTGPGGINALNGVFGAFVDSIPMVVVSGQIKRETMVSHYELPLRQLGDQEVDIVAMAAPIVKLAVVLDDPTTTESVLEEACAIAIDGRPGPVWIDVPLDVQGAPAIETHSRESASTRWPRSNLTTGRSLEGALAEAIDRLGKSERPVVLAGAGVRISGAHELFLNVIDKLGIPVTSGWNAHDVIYDDHPLYVGRPGTLGDRAGNFAVQNADFLLVLGSRLNIRQISYNWNSFARAAYTVMIDADAAELAKPTLHVDLPINADLREALGILESSIDYSRKEQHGEYLTWCLERRIRYPVETSVPTGPDGSLDPYHFLAVLFDELAENEVIVTGDGSACVISFQVAKIRRGQRIYTNSGCASMGYDLPAALGAATARPGERVVCIAGDGSIMLNLQELQTIAGYRLPVKIFVINNNGYSSIRQTQSAYFPDNIVGCDPESGVTFPDFVAVARSFGLKARRCAAPEDALEMIRETLRGDAPALLEVVVDPEKPFTPKLSSRTLDDGTMVSSPLEDMAPFLSRQELLENLLIEPASES